MTALQLSHSIRVIGVGGGGSNAVDRMIQVGIAGVDFIAANTDVQALRLSESCNTLHLGPRATRGLGAGADPAVGARAANESKALIEEACQGTELLFITAGMGGGTGSGAAPKIAHVARANGAVVVGVVTMPFAFEGTRRRSNADAALEALREEVDTLVVVHNDRLLQILDPQHARMDIAFRVADECLRQAIEGITNLIHSSGVINLDFADLKSVLRDGGLGHFAIGYGQGEDAAQEAMRRALSSPLLGRDGIEGAQAVVVNFQGSDEMSLYDVKQAMEPVNRLVADEAPIFFGTSVDAALGERVEVTLMAVGLDSMATSSVSSSFTRNTSATAPRPADRHVPTEERENEAPKIIPIREAKAAPAPERPWHVAASPLSEEDEPYPMDELSIPAFLRRRKRVTA
ncbi:MAG: cell division protein FtsZ [Chloroflexota bacterium]|nr:cell division protein FtsZ [Chloroflexota bacterium]